MSDKRQFVQDFTASLTWNVEHKLNRGVITEVFVPDPDYVPGPYGQPRYTVMIPDSITKIDNNFIRITFTAPTAGRVRCI